MVDRIFRTLIAEVRIWFEAIFVKDVPGRIGVLVRRLYWATKFRQSKTFYLDPGCIIVEPANITIGDGVEIRRRCELYANDSGSITIGDRVGINSGSMINAADNGEIIIQNDVLIGPNVIMRSSNHAYARKDIPINRQGHIGGKIVIEEDVWVGGRCIILPDVTIGKGAVIGAGAVVTKDVPPYSLAAGAPAKVIRENVRSSKETQ